MNATDLVVEVRALCAQVGSAEPDRLRLPVDALTIPVDSLLEAFAQAQREELAVAYQVARGMDLAGHHVQAHSALKALASRADGQTESLSARLRCLDEELLWAGVIEEARGFEGAATAAYFADIGALFKEPWEFRERNRRPPKDPVNALLSLGYTLLLTRCIAALQVAGLDVDVGFLHTSHHGSPALALDMMEEFRPTIVDTLVLRVLNGGVLTPKDFTSDDRLPCKLTGEAFKTYVGEFERRLATEFTPEGRVTATTYAEFIRDQAMAIRRTSRLARTWS